MSLQSQMRYMNPYEVHKMLINTYVLKQPGDTLKLFQRDTSKDKRDIDVLREHHKFLWDDDSQPETWEEQFAKKYYDKLFKEYCIADLTFYKENKIAMRWRTEQEVVTGRGQFSCGNKHCTSKEELRTWEVNFAYVEEGTKKNALVKIRLCPDCSKKLNYKSKKKEVRRLKNKKSHTKSHTDKAKSSTSKETEERSSQEEMQSTSSSNPWDNIKPVEAKSREEEMEDYLEDLLL